MASLAGLAGRVRPLASRWRGCPARGTAAPGGVPVRATGPVGGSGPVAATDPVTAGDPADAGGPADATARRVERAVAVFVAAMRLAVVVQLLPALPTGARLATRPAAYLAVSGTAVAVAAAVSAVSLRRGRPPGPVLTAADLALAAAALVALSLLLPAGARLGSWAGWAAGYALVVAVTSGAVRSRAVWLGGLAAVVAGYLVWADPVLAVRLPTVVGNVLGYAVLSATVRVVVGRIRAVARTADGARAEVARLARREEERRAHLAMHDAATVMALLADPAQPAAVRRELQVQAATEARRMRSYLRGEDAGRPGDPAGVRAAVAQACEGFADLGPLLRTDLLDDVRLRPGPAAALVSALRAVLHNVRVHAGATGVVVHGDADETPDATGRRRWTVTVADDGRGFDPSAVTLGVGLRTQVIGELARHGIACRVDSRPGRGTRVEVSGVAR